MEVETLCNTFPTFLFFLSLLMKNTRNACEITCMKLSRCLIAKVYQTFKPGVKIVLYL